MNFEALFKQIIAFFNKLNKQQRYIIIGSIIAVIAIIAFLIVFNTTSSKPKNNYAILFENLKPQDAALIVQYLEKKNIPYVIPKDGVIEVPKNEVAKLRLDIAAQGLPKSSTVGFELFNKSSFGATDFEERIKYLRALEGELERTIESIDAVESAKVNIALPKESVFVSKQTPPTASVLIKLKPNMILTPKQIQGIKYLVAAAVPKLKPENVKIVDQYGNPLGENDELTQNNELLKTEMIYKKRFEKSLEDKIISILAPIVGGKDKVVAKVNVDFDFSQVKSKSTIYDPNNVVRSEQSIEESRISTKPKKEVGGVPGAVSNIGPVQGLKNSNVVDKYNKSETTTNYEISTTIKNVKAPFAKIKRITAAVVVDGHYQKDKNGKVKFIPLSKIELANIENLVKNTIGFDPKRGDSVSVTSFEFATANNVQAVSKTQMIMEKVSMYLGPFAPVLKYLILAIILFVFYKKVIVPFSEKMLEVKLEEEQPVKKEVEISEEEIESTYDKIKELKEKVEQQLGISGEINEEELKYEVLLERVTKIVEENTEQVAKVLENLIKEEHTEI